MSDFAIFIALPEELGAAIDILKENGNFSGRRSDIEAGRTRFLYKLGPGPGEGKEGDVFLIRGMGNTKSAAFVGASLAHASPPRHALLVGISGSLDPENVHLGDVVISSHVKYYSPDKIKDIPEGGCNVVCSDDARKICDNSNSMQVNDVRKESEILIDERDVRFSNSFYRYIRQRICRNDEEYNIDKFMMIRHELYGPHCAPEFKLHSGAVLGSNMVLDSHSFVNYLLEKNRCTDMDFYSLNSPKEFKERCSWDSSELLAVDMESYGFFSAFEDMKSFSTVVQAVAVRGISDLAAGKSNLDQESKGEHRQIATARAVRVAIDYLHAQYGNQRFEISGNDFRGIQGAVD